MNNAKVIIDGVEYVPKVAETKEIEDKEWPKNGDKVFYLIAFGTREDLYFDNDSVLKAFKAQKQLFPTEQKAEYERLRRECMATRWVPAKGSEFYCYCFRLKHVASSERLDLWIPEVMIALAAPTKEEAQARWDKYGEAWLDVFKT